MSFPPGNAYIYYSGSGQLPCVNFVCDSENFGSAVLIRAIYPSCNPEVMYDRRKTEREQAYLKDEKRREKNLCNGPGVLCEALGINDEHYKQSKERLSLFSSPFEVRAAVDPNLKKTSGIRIGLDSQLGRWLKEQPDRAPIAVINEAAEQPLRWLADDFRNYSRHPSSNQIWKRV